MDLYPASIELIEIGCEGANMAEITDPNMYESIRAAIMGPQSEPLVFTPAPSNVTDMRTRKPYYAPNSLARTLANISDAFRPVRSDG
jgi:hypothetical protein